MNFLSSISSYFFTPRDEYKETIKPYDGPELLTKSFTQFEKLMVKNKRMMRIEFLQFLKFEEIVKISLLNRTINKIVDPNKDIIKIDENGRVTYLLKNGEEPDLELHFQNIAVI